MVNNFRQNLSDIELRPHMPEMVRMHAAVSHYLDSKECGSDMHMKMRATKLLPMYGFNWTGKRGFLQHVLM